MRLLITTPPFLALARGYLLPKPSHHKIPKTSTSAAPSLSRRQGKINALVTVTASPSPVTNPTTTYVTVPFPTSSDANGLQNDAAPPQFTPAKIAGIVLGVLICGALLGLSSWVFWIWRVRKVEKEEEEERIVGVEEVEGKLHPEEEGGGSPKLEVERYESLRFDVDEILSGGSGTGKEKGDAGANTTTHLSTVKTPNPAPIGRVNSSGSARWRLPDATTVRTVAAKKDGSVTVPVRSESHRRSSSDNVLWTRPDYIENLFSPAIAPNVLPDRAVVPVVEDVRQRGMERSHIAKSYTPTEPPPPTETDKTILEGSAPCSIPLPTTSDSTTPLKQHSSKPTSDSPLPLSLTPGGTARPPSSNWPFLDDPDLISPAPLHREASMKALAGPGYTSVDDYTPSKYHPSPPEDGKTRAQTFHGFYGPASPQDDDETDGEEEGKISKYVDCPPPSTLPGKPQALHGFYSPASSPQDNDEEEEVGGVSEYRSSPPPTLPGKARPLSAEQEYSLAKFPGTPTPAAGKGSSAMGLSEAERSQFPSRIPVAKNGKDREKERNRGWMAGGFELPIRQDSGVEFVRESHSPSASLERSKAVGFALAAMGSAAGAGDEGESEDELYGVSEHGKGKKAVERDSESDDELYTSYDLSGDGKGKGKGIKVVEVESESEDELYEVSDDEKRKSRTVLRMKKEQNKRELEAEKAEEELEDAKTVEVQQNGGEQNQVVDVVGEEDEGKKIDALQKTNDIPASSTPEPLGTPSKDYLSDEKTPSRFSLGLEKVKEEEEEEDEQAGDVHKRDQGVYKAPAWAYGRDGELSEFGKYIYQ